MEKAKISSDDLLKFAEMTGMIDTDDVLEQMNKKRKKEILENHPYDIYQGAGKDTRWRTHVTDPTKKEGRRLLCRKKKEDLLEDIYAHYENLEHQEEIRTDQITLEDLYPQWIEYKRLHTTASTYISRIDSDWRTYYLGTEIAKKPLRKLTKLDLDKWAHTMIQTYDMTRKKYINVQVIMRQALDYAVDLGIIDFNPMTQVKVDRKMYRREKKKPDKTQVYTADEIKAITDLAWKDFQAETKDYRLSPLALIFQYQTGVRVGELVVLRYEDIEKPNYIHVQRMYRRDSHEIVEHTKSDDGDRQVYLTKYAREIIEVAREYQRTHGHDSEGFIFALDGQIIPQRCINSLLMKYCKILDIPYRSSHKNRKSYGSALLNSGVSINTARQMLGHADEETTLKYYCYDQTMDADKEQQFEKALKPGISFTR